MRTKNIFIMLNIFKKMFEYHFFLPSEFSFLKNDLTTKDIEKMLKQYNFIFDKIKCQKVGEYLYFISVFCFTENKISVFKVRMSEFKEIVPPWVAFPDLFQGSPRWNQGFEESYGIYWSDFFLRLEAIEKKEYLLKYNCPNEWIQWLNEVKYL